ncbi:MAG: hypothetical protein AAGL29_12155 [Bacteroidota bacterium]
MKKPSRPSTYIFGIALVLLLSAIAFWYFQKPLDVSKATPEMSISAENLLAQLKDTTTQLTVLNAEEVVEIHGVIKEINTLNGRETLILQGGADIKSYIICDMKAGQTETLNQLHEKDSITLKGIYKGFLKDAIFLNCVLTRTHQP